MHMSSEFGEDISFCSRVIAFFVKLVHEFECFGSPGFLFSLDRSDSILVKIRQTVEDEFKKKGFQHESKWRTGSFA